MHYTTTHFNALHHRMYFVERTFNKKRRENRNIKKKPCILKILGDQRQLESLVASLRPGMLLLAILAEAREGLMGIFCVTPRLPLPDLDKVVTALHYSALEHSGWDQSTSVGVLVILHIRRV